MSSIASRERLLRDRYSRGEPLVLYGARAKEREKLLNPLDLALIYLKIFVGCAFAQALASGDAAHFKAFSSSSRNCGFSQAVAPWPC